MSHKRRSNGEETRYRLLDWIGGQAPAERLSSHILSVEGYKFIDPSHPFGGKDGTKDMLCEKDRDIWIGACYFPRGQQSFGRIKKKFSQDLSGVLKNRASGLAFVTNQALTISKRKELINLTSIKVDIFHLDRIVNILNNPHSYGARQDFLDINMTREEEISAYAFSVEKLQELLYELTDIKPSEIVYNSYEIDPAAGSASFLISAVRKIEQHNIYKDMEFNQFFNSLDYSTGININSQNELIRLDKANQYDVIITDPIITPNENLEVNFIKEHYLSTVNQLNILKQTIMSLKPTERSRAAIVLSDRTLRGKAGKEIRRELIEECDLEMILRLPHNFYKRVKDEMNVLFFKKKNKENLDNKEVWIYNLRNTLTEDNKSIEILFQEFKETYKQKNFHSNNYFKVSLEEIIELDYNLDFSSPF